VWRVSGHEVPVKTVVACVEGYKERFTLVTSAAGFDRVAGVETVRARSAGGRVPEPDESNGLGWRSAGRGPESLRADEPGAVVTIACWRLTSPVEAEGEWDWWFRPAVGLEEGRPACWTWRRLFRVIARRSATSIGLAGDRRGRA